MTRRSIEWNSERLLSLSAMSISFITLVIFIYQTNLMRRQNYISILPYLTLSTTNDLTGHTFVLKLENHGVGPAILESVKLTYQGKSYDLAAYENQLFPLLVSLKPELDSIQMVNYSTLNKGMAIPANFGYTLLSVSQSPEHFQLLTHHLNQLEAEGLKYEITYKSIQEERWRIFTDSQGPERVK